MTNQDYKNSALDALRGNWAPAIVCAIVYMLVTSVVIGPSYSADMVASGMMHISPDVATAFTWSSFPLTVFILSPLMLGYIVSFNRLYVDGDSALTSNLFKETFSGYLRNVWGMFLMNILIVLWTLLLVIPGVIKAFSYAMTPYILKDYPELSANQAINLSRKMMKGHKLDLFLLNLSFLGWFLLCLLTCGIGFVWFMPYVQTANAIFYQDVKKKLTEKPFNN